MSKVDERPALLASQSKVRRDVFKVHMPRNPANVEQFATFVSSLNKELARVGEKFSKIPSLDPSFNPSDYVRNDQLEDKIDTIEEAAAGLYSSEGEDEAKVGSGKRGRRASRRRKQILEAAEAVIQNAIPTTAPPAVAAASAVGTTTNPTLFALADHTHKGVDFTASGSAGQVAFFTGTNTINSDAALTFVTTTGELLLSPGSFVRSFDVGTPTVPTESYLLYAEQLTLSGTHTLTVLGTGVVRGV